MITLAKQPLYALARGDLIMIAEEVNCSRVQWKIANIHMYIYSSVKVLITAGANIVLYNEGAVITNCFRRLLSS